MEVYNCNKATCKRKSRIKTCGTCKQKIQFNVKCPTQIPPVFPKTEVDFRRLTVGNGFGPLANQFTATVPAGTQSLYVIACAAGGGGGGQVTEIFSYFILFLQIAQTVQAAGGGGGGFRTEFARPYAAAVGFPTTLDIIVGTASPVPTDLTTGFGIDGGDSCVTFSPVVAGFPPVLAKGGKGGCGAKSTGNAAGFAGNGSPGGNGGGGAGAATLFTVPNTPLAFGVGGVGFQQENGEDGDLALGGNGGLNLLSGSAGVVSAEAASGGGGGGGSGVGIRSSGGPGGPAGTALVSNAGGDFRIQNSCGGGGGCGVYTPAFAEVGTTITKSGGVAAHGFVELFFHIFPPAT